MKISIALCTYNGERYLSDQLASYLEQERLPDELVVCDDNSKDNTKEILAAFAKQSPFPVRIFSNEINLGSTKNFEKAFQLCEGDIILPSDQDDIWDKSKLQRLETIFIENPQVGLVFTNANVVDENLVSLGYTLWQSIKFTPAEQQMVCKGKVIPVFMKHNMVTGATMGFRADLRKVFMPIPSLWIHDAWITFMIAMVAHILPIPEGLIQYRQHEHNLVGTPGTSFLNKIGYALNQDKNLQSRIYDQYRILQKRVENQFPQEEAILHQINEQILHRNIRRDLPKKRFKRLPAILQELLTGRYHQYSSGYRGAAKDFLT